MQMGFLDRFKRTADNHTPQRSSSPAASLEDVAGGADRIAVVDCETTGVYHSDRVVEVAIVTLDLNGQVVDTWDTLIHPQRDVGASHIHGLTAVSLQDAPTFADVAGDVAIRLHGACLAAHNLPFDSRMLTNEYSRLGADLAVIAGLDTLSATRCRLSVACASHRITHDDAHSALADAIATAELLSRVAAGCGNGSPAAAPVGLTRSGRVLRRRDVSPVIIPDPPHVARLAMSLNHEGLEANVLSYLDVVGRAVADLHIDARERTELAGFAAQLGLGPAQLAQAHRRYLNDLIDAALNDLVITEAELDMLLRVASALEVNPATVEQRTRPARATTASIELTAGMSVTFTGDDPAHPRDELINHAIQLGMTVGKNVTKTTDLLVAYETSTASGKATKARSYSVPIVTTGTFASARLRDHLEAETSAVEAKKVVTCPDCHATWTVSGKSGGQSSRRCPDCATTSSPTKVPEAVSLADATAETLECSACGRAWTRERVRGRKPHRCPDCAV